MLGVNGGSMRSHRRFSDKHGFDFDLLVDDGHAVALAYDIGTLTSRFLRTVVGVDKQGVITYYQRGMPSVDAILTGMGLASG